MPPKTTRPPLGGIDMSPEIDPIREYGLKKGFLPTDPGEPAAAAPPPKAPVAPSIPEIPEPPRLVRPAPTRPWQAMLPDYLIEDLRQAAAREGTAQKVIVLRALRQAGYRVDDIDLQDLRRR
ncbi:hypothetical protein J2847_006650 [Azospirillum agricola]|uniref:hypothetical protein n=1 Tax=Azospirillum agricola TaxID=1720247 RepID=UPI001AE1975A|nr:hypothetical protein [Azospirillum agricola]MBP2233313.1 hypothetical protein [Azospirillum agricola]